MANYFSAFAEGCSDIELFCKFVPGDGFVSSLGKPLYCVS
ncbi:hypothetical protein BpHYR1_030916, partial [Brachionus plicatilis]